MKTLLALCFASIYGVLLRVVFGMQEGLFQIMSVSFLLLTPMIIGFLSVILLPKKRIKSSVGAFFIPWITALIILIITMAINLEGSICWIMIYPLFSILAGFGGIIAYKVRKIKSGEKLNNNSKLSVSIILLLPFIIGYIEGDKSLSAKHYNIEETVIISATNSKVWDVITNINEVKHTDKGFSISQLIGFPKHLRTELDTLAVGGNRVAYYENGLYFKERIAELKPATLLVLDIHTDPDNIPATVMDEHIVIGGKHVDIEQDRYLLTALPGGATQLTLSSKFYINTPFNWYSGIWADFLMRDILKEQLQLIKSRAETKK